MNEDQVRAELTAGAVMAAVREAFVDLSTGISVQPEQVAADLPGDRGDVIYYPAVVPDSIGVTVSPYLTELAGTPSGPVTAYTLLLSAQTGRPVLLCDSEHLVAVRTGATTALAVEALGGVEGRRIAVFGAGPIARSHVTALAELGRWERLDVYSPTLADPSRADDRAALMSLADGVGLASSAEAAVADADVVLLCTSSTTPVLDPSKVKPTALITSVSTNGPLAHEVPPEALAAMDVYCDYRRTAPSGAGEMVLARERHGWSADAVVADLPELLSGTARPLPSRGRPRYFRSIGLGIEDVAAARLLV
ncbi:ornithine cyclodeaminase family protein [Streptomyces sp. TS71-3]|uniref:ornithine cyclodeaminase family protein n=1 Tax=Streptomyces sp. TS71-3 TaxID=2733862 RepID=UPI002017E489|nr:hypothetical protein [Streptomyces sp. TS71-3]